MNLKYKILTPVLILLIFGAASSAFAEEKEKVLGVDPILIETALKGKDLGFQRKYDEAIALFRKLQQEYPDSATGFFGEMAMWQVRMFENDDYRYRRQYEAVEKKFERKSLHKLRKGDVSSWELFVIGAADGMRGFFKGRQGKWFQSLKHGLHAMRMFKQLKFQEPNLIDTDLGFGMYKYWRSVFTNEIKFLPFFSDQRAEGMKLVQNVANSGKYAKDLALANLIFIYGNQDKHDDAVRVADLILAKYPNSIIVKYQKGRNLRWAKKYKEAIKVFEEIYKQDPAITKALLQKGMALFKMKEYDKSQAALESFVKLDKQKDYLAVAYYWLGRIAETKDDKAGAISHYEKSLSLHKLKAAKSRLTKLRG